jgi:hypothetical protein
VADKPAWIAELGMFWGGRCPKGGCAEDFLHPLGPLGRYSELKETPSAQPEQRTQWNVRDSDAIPIIVDRDGILASGGTSSAQEWAISLRKSLLIIDVGPPDAAAKIAEWLQAQCKPFGPHIKLGVGGPRESAWNLHKRAPTDGQRVLSCSN